MNFFSYLKVDFELSCQHDVGDIGDKGKNQIIPTTEDISRWFFSPLVLAMSKLTWEMQVAER